MEWSIRIIKGALAAAVSFWQTLPELTHVLLALMAIDVCFGFAIALKQRRLSAARMFDGATKKIGMLFMVAIAVLLNPYVQAFIDMNLVQAATFFYVATELLSITRNAAVLDVPVFNQLNPVLRYFQEVAEMAEGPPQAKNVEKDEK